MLEKLFSGQVELLVLMKAENIFTNIHERLLRSAVAINKYKSDMLISNLCCKFNIMYASNVCHEILEM